MESPKASLVFNLRFFGVGVNHGGRAVPNRCHPFRLPFYHTAFAEFRRKSSCGIARTLAAL